MMASKLLLPPTFGGSQFSKSRVRGEPTVAGDPPPPIFSRNDSRKRRGRVARMVGNWGLTDKSNTDLGSVTGKHLFTSGDCKCEQVGDDELG